MTCLKYNKLISPFISVSILLIIPSLLFTCGQNNYVNSQSTGDKPSPPKNVKAAPERELITITWDSVADAESFNLYWAYHKDVTYEAKRIKNVDSPFKHKGLRVDSTYYYRLTSVNEFGEGAMSKEVKAVPLPRVDIPGVPGNIHATAGDKKVLITWDTVPDVIKYNIYWSETSGVNKKSTKISNAERPFIHGNLSNGTMYYYRVSAENETGESELSTTKYAVPNPATAVPNPPNNIKIYERDSLLTFTWDPVINASLFNVYWSFGSTVTKAANKEIATTTPFDLINLKNNKKIYIRISSTNDIGEGQLSVTYSAVPMPLLPPWDLKKSETYKQVTLTWGDVANAASYNLYWLSSATDDSIPYKISNASTPFVHDSLDPSGIYRYYVTSANPFEESIPSRFAIARPILVPPDKITAKGGYKENRLVWSSVPNVPAYLVKWRTGFGNDAKTGTEICSASSLTHSGLPLITKYYYEVFSKDGDSLSAEFSSAYAKTILDKPKANAGKDKQVTIGDKVHLKGVGADSAGDIEKYEWKIGDSDWVKTSSGDTAITAPDTAASIICSLRVTDDDGLTDTDYLKIIIALDPPTVSLKANPTTTGLNDTVALTVEASDNGQIMSHEMKFGDNDWIPVSGNDTTVNTPFDAGAWICLLKVTDDDGEYAVGRVTIKVKSNPPKVTVQGKPRKTGLNDPVTLTGKATDNGSVTKYEWKMGDSEWIKTTPGDTIVKTPITPGTWICSLRVTDDDREISYNAVKINVESSPPITTAGSDVQTTGFNDPVIFTGNATDNGVVELYEWKFGDNDWISVSDGDTTIKSPSDTGVWVCILRATDDDGEAAYDTLKISITSNPPVVTASSNISETGFNDPVEFSGEVVDNEATFQYFWKFGIGDWAEAQNITITKNAPFKAGAWVCSLKVTDADGETGFARVIIDVKSSPPTITATGSPLTTGLNEPVTLSVTASDDGNIERFEWKLGENDWFTTSGNDTIVYTPLAPGTWLCSLRVTDDDKEQSSDAVSITVESSPPVVQATATPLNTGLNDPLAFTANATDNGSVEKYEWKFGEGNWVEVSDGDTAFNTLSTPGTWICSLKVTDDDFETTVKSFQITFSSIPPKVKASSNPTTTVGLNESIQFFGAATDNGSIVSYEWKFGASGWVAVGNGDTTLTSPSTMQIWVCSLRVVDDDNEIGYDELSFYVDPRTVTDIDGNSYPTIRIGVRLWTAVNLRVTKYNDGSSIPHVPDSATWGSYSTGAYCFYGNTTDMAARQKFGALYNFYAVSTGKLAPEGWRVPTKSDIDILLNYLDENGYNCRIEHTAGKAVASKTDWNISTTRCDVGYDQESNNTTGMNIYPGGYRAFNGNFRVLNEYARLYTSSIMGPGSFYIYGLEYNGEHFYINYSSNEKTGYSIRLIKE